MFDDDGDIEGVGGFELGVGRIYVRGRVLCERGGKPSELGRI